MSRSFGVEESELHVVQFERLRPNQFVFGIGELSPEQIAEFAPEPQPMVDAAHQRIGMGPR